MVVLIYKLFHAFNILKKFTNHCDTKKNTTSMFSVGGNTKGNGEPCGKCKQFIVEKSEFSVVWGVPFLIVCVMLWAFSKGLEVYEHLWFAPVLDGMRLVYNKVEKTRN